VRGDMISLPVDASYMGALLYLALSAR
jgi:hypothetical protein